MSNNTYFKLPNDPDQVGVYLPPAELRKIDFSSLDYNSGLQSVFEYIKTYYPDIFNDFSDNSGVVMLSEIVSIVCAKLGLRGDLLAKNNYVGLVTDEKAMSELISLIGQTMKRQTPSTVEVEVSLQNAMSSDLSIKPKTTIQVSDDVYYELFKAPGDYTNDIIIPAGKRGVIALGVEGQFAADKVIVSDGAINQTYTISDSNILEDPLFVYVATNDSTVPVKWKIVKDPIEMYQASDKVVEARFKGDNLILRFGDGVTGAIPESGDTITVQYRKGGGVKGRIGNGQIDTSITITPTNGFASVPVRFRNLVPSRGGLDKETVSQARRRAPKEASIHKNIVTPDDYLIASTGYSHPVFGSIAKALATTKTSLNANVVELHVLALGDSGALSAPSNGLKNGLKTYIESLCPNTTEIRVLDGKNRLIDLDMSIIISRNSDSVIVKNNVQSVINNFFDQSRWSMGQPFYLSDFIQTVKSVDGVLYVDIITPNSNILDIAFNEVVGPGTQQQIMYYYEKDKR